MKRILLYIVIFIFLTEFKSYAGDSVSSYEGTHFYIGFMQNEIEILTGGITLQIFITSSSNAHVSVDIPGMNETVYNINPKQVLRLDMPSYIENREDEQNIAKAVEISSDVPIAVYSFNSELTTSDSYSAIPISFWGKEYVVMSMPNDQYKTQLDPQDQDSSLIIPRSSEFMVMAAYDNTIIQFQPKAITRAGKQTYQKYTITMNKGDCYLVQSFPFIRGYGDLSGTIISSNQPIGVLSGHVRTAIPQNDWGSNNKNHLCEMLAPTDAWGKEYLSVPFGTNPDGDLFKLTSIYDSTIVTYRNPFGLQTITLPVAGSVASVWDASQPTAWQSNKPVQIAQLMRHEFGFDQNTSFDPCMVMLPPAEQYVSRILFQTMGNPPLNPFQFPEQYIYIVAEQSAVSSLTIDGQLVTDLIPGFTLQNIPGTQYNWVRLRINDGVHEVYSQNGKFSGVIFGEGFADAYAMTLGSSLNNPYKDDSVPPSVTVNEECGRLTGVVSEAIDSINSGINFVHVLEDLTVNYNWNIQTYTDTSTSVTFTAEPIDPTIDGQFVLEALDRNNNSYQYKYIYKGLNVSLPDSIDFGIIVIRDTACTSFELINKSSDTLNIDSTQLSGDSRLWLKTDTSKSKLLLPGDTIYYDLCFSPDTNITPLAANLSVGFGCNRIKSIPVIGFVESPNLSARGYQFGKVRIGDTVCNTVSIINKGNLPVRLNSLATIFYSSAFNFDTTGLFPYILNVGDSILIKVCFTPDTLRNYSTQQKAENDHSIQNVIVVTGEGAAPHFNSILVDWGRRRIGTKNDTTIYIKNTGSFTGQIIFEKFENSSDSFDSNSIGQIFYDLNPGDSVPVSLSFLPGDTLDYDLKAGLKVDWSRHEPVTFELKGEGTIPNIIPVDVVFDTTKIFDRRDTLTAIIRSTGKEQLTIDSIYYFSGDRSSFIINTENLKNKIINPLAGDSGLICPISFKPQKLGNNEMMLEVLNDAAPAYKRQKTYIKISGYAKARDTIEPTLNIEMPGFLIPCKSDTVYIKIGNTGNTDAVLQALSLQSDNLNVWWLDSIQLPEIIPPDSLIVFRAMTVFQNVIEGKILVSAKFNDTIIKSVQYSVIPENNPLVIFDEQDLNLTPGDTLILNLAGKFPNPSIIPVDFKLKIIVNQKNLFLVNKNFDILLKNSRGIEKYRAILEQNSYEVTLQSLEKIDLSEAGDWSVDVKFLVLLNNEQNYKINIIARADSCYDEDSTGFNAEITGVCAFPIRAVTLGDITAPIIRIMPNPVSDELKLNIVMPHDDWVKIEIFDNFGKKYVETENFTSTLQSPASLKSIFSRL